MDIKEYFKEASRTDAPLSSKREHDLHMVLGMVTEVGELADQFKKNLAYGKELDGFNIIEEIGDLMWYVANFCTSNNIDFEKLLEVNIGKLALRYPEKFTEYFAAHRDLDGERKILEGEG
jgi:NTP pyrophosphatase (non-canonical NTP hydrolase)